MLAERVEPFSLQRRFDGVRLPRRPARGGPASTGSLLRMGTVRRLSSLPEEFRGRLARYRDPVAFWRSQGATIGDRCRLISCDLGSEPYLVTLGDHVSATATAFVTHDGGAWVLRHEWPDADLIAPITVGDNVFFGSGCLVLPGATIGSDVVVGAHSVVVRDVPSGCVVAGVPARHIRSLDEYRRDAQERMVPTARMDRPAKRAWLQRHFG